MALTPGKALVRRLTGLTPLLVVGLLFLAPAIIWLIKDDPKPFEQVEVPGRILTTEGQSSRGGPDMVRLTVKLDTGETIRLEARLDALPVTGDMLTVLRATDEDGAVTFRLKP